MRTCVLILITAILFSGSCVLDVGLGPNCELNCESCGSCEAVLPVCGDGRVDPTEDCDGAESCDSQCHNTECGNGVLEEGESCDGGPRNGDRICSLTCIQLEPAQCGDSIVETGEQCDDGNTSDRDGCSFDCQLEDQSSSSCGDSILQVGEECDDGNLEFDDGCAANCQVEMGWNCTFSSPGSVCEIS